MMTEASQYLRKLAAELVQPYTALPSCRAAILTGSASEGVSDFYSDLDIILYYEQLPPEDALLAAIETNGGANRRIFGERTETDFGEQYTVRGVECQFAHATVTGWERDMASVMQALDVKSPLQKALGGMEDAIPLDGESLVRQWKETVRQYPDALRDAMIQEHLTFFPLWGLHDRLGPRDATIWINQVMVESAYNLLGILAGLNRQYFSEFQFKRMQRFLSKLPIQPDHFGERIEGLFHAAPSDAAQQLEALVDETLRLVETHLPHLDTSRARARIGWRHKTWTTT